MKILDDNEKVLATKYGDQIVEEKLGIKLLGLFGKYPTISYLEEDFQKSPVLEIKSYSEKKVENAILQSK